MKRFFVTCALTLTCASWGAAADDKTYDINWALEDGTPPLTCAAVGRVVTTAEFNKKLTLGGSVGTLYCGNIGYNAVAMRVEVTDVTPDSNPLTRSVLTSEKADGEWLLGPSPLPVTLAPDEGFEVIVRPDREAGKSDAGNHTVKIRVVNTIS